LSYLQSFSDLPKRKKEISSSRTLSKPRERLQRLGGPRLIREFSARARAESASGLAFDAKEIRPRPNLQKSVPQGSRKGQSSKALLKCPELQNSPS